MVIETAGERIYLSGSLRTNQWEAIRTVVGLLLQSYPEGVVIDCAALSRVSVAGERTFVEAIHEIERAALPVMLAHLSPSLESTLEREIGGQLYRYLAGSLEAVRVQQALAAPEWWQRLWGATE